MTYTQADLDAAWRAGRDAAAAVNDARVNNLRRVMGGGEPLPRPDAWLADVLVCALDTAACDIRALQPPEPRT